jgi:hypothetical protein
MARSEHTAWAGALGQGPGPGPAPLFHSFVAKLLYINIETVKIMVREGCRQYAWYFI